MANTDRPTVHDEQSVSHWQRRECCLACTFETSSKRLHCLRCRKHRLATKTCQTAQQPPEAQRPELMTTMRRQWCWSWWQGHSGGDCKCVEHVFGEAVDTPPRRDHDHCRRFNSTTASEHQRFSVQCRESCGHQHQHAPFNHIGHPVHGCVFLSHRTLCHLVCFVHVAMSVGFVHTCMLKVCNACTHSEHMFSFNSSELENIAVLPHDC